MDTKTFEKEHLELKEKLIRLVNYTNSEEYFKLDPIKKTLIDQYKTSTEISLSNLSQLLYSDSINSSMDSSSFILPLMLAMIKGPSGFSPTSSDVFTMPTKEIEAPEEEDVNKEEQAN